MTIRKEVLDELLAGAEGKEEFGKDGLFDDLKKALAERMLNAEMDHHLGQEPGMDLYRLSDNLGHATTQMTQRYAHLATRNLHRAVGEMETNLTTYEQETPPSASAK